MRFMHISDVHLGVEPDAGKEWSKRRAKDIWDSLAETVAEAGRQQVDFLLISGDLFHRQPLKRELKEVNYLFSQVPQVKVVLVAGNHDHMQSKCYYLDFEWAENVFFFKKEEITSFDFPNENVTIYGMSYWHKKLPKRFYDNLGVTTTGRINILLAHGGDDEHIPYSAKQVLEQGIDYIAGGHLHTGRQLVEDKAIIAGPLEPTESKEVGPHGYWIGEITKRGKSTEQHVHFYPIKKCEYCNEILEVTSKTTMYELESQIRDIVAAGESYKMYRIFLEGYMDPEQTYDFTSLEKISQIVAVFANLQPDYDYEKMLEEQPNSLLGRYIEKMQRLPQDVVTKKAMEYGVNALLGRDTCR